MYLCIFKIAALETRFLMSSISKIIYFSYVIKKAKSTFGVSGAQRFFLADKIVNGINFL